MGIGDVLQVSRQIKFCFCAAVINKCHPQQNFLPSFLNFWLPKSLIGLKQGKTLIFMKRSPEFFALCVKTLCQKACCVCFDLHFTIDLNIGYCFPSSKASIKSWQQGLSKIHVLVVWLLYSYYQLLIFFVSFCMCWASGLQCRGTIKTPV